MKIFLFAGLLLKHSVCDNFHSTGTSLIYCNNEALNVECSSDRWKVSYLGADENVLVEEKNKVIYISGIEKTGKSTSTKNNSVFYPKGYKLVLSSDRVHTITVKVPEKVVYGALGVLLSLLPSFLIYIVGKRIYK